jgi:hypothetical protein
MSLSAEQVERLIIGEVLVYQGQDPATSLPVNGTVTRNDEEILFVELANGNGVTFYLPNCPDGISSLSYPAGRNSGV